MRRGEGQGAEHRYLVAHRYVTASEAPPPYPNPRAEFREGGPDGTHWYHGSDVPFKGPLKPTERDYGHASTDHTHWNTDLGVHFTSSHDLARSFARNFAGTDSATPEHARIAHATLHMRNPADFENEHDLADHAIRTARRHGLRYGETDDPELQDVNDGHEDEVSLLKKDHWLSSHPHREQIVGHVERDLKKAGHDGIVYGNSYEGSPGDKSAIAFRDTPVAIHHWEHLHPQHPGHGRTAARKPTLLYHGTAADEDPERIEPGPDGYAYASKSPLHALYHAQAAAASGGEPHVYEVKHLGRPADLDERPGEQHAWRSTKGFQVLRRSPIGLAPAPANEKEAHVREAGKGKPRRDAPDVDRRAQAPSGDAGAGVDAHPGGDADGPAAHLDEHPQVARDLKKLHPRLRSVYDERVDGLRDGNPHSSTHALSGALSGWQGTSLDWRHRLVHRTVGDALHVLSVGVHDAAYDQGARRTGMLRTAEIRMVPPEEFGRFSYPDYPQARTPSQLVKHFKKTSPEYYHKIRDDVQRNGFTTPVLVRYKDGGGRALKKPQVMEGHHRAAVAHDLGVHLPVGDYDNDADYGEAFSGGQQWFRDNARPSGDMPGKEGALQDGGFTFEHVERHPLWGQPAIVAHHPDARDDHGFANHAGHLMWHRDQKHVGLVYVDPDFQRRGLATELWHRAKQVEPGLKHSTEQTADGRGWASTVARLGRYTAPKERLFGRTYGLDKRLFEGDRLRPAIREDIMARFDAFCRERGLVDWQSWAKIVFFGSEASEWTSKTLEGNGDFDLSIGIDYARLRASNPQFDGLDDKGTADAFTKAMHEALNADDEWFAVDFRTWPQNSNSMSNGPSSSTSQAGAPPASPGKRASMSPPFVGRSDWPESPDGTTEPRSARSGRPAVTAGPTLAERLIPSSSRCTARSVPSASGSIFGPISSALVTGSPSSNTTPSWNPKAAAAPYAPGVTSSWQSITTTPVALASAAAASASGEFSARAAIKRSATSESIILGPHSAISPDGPPSIPLPEGWHWIGPFSHTWFCNLLGWDIRQIRPYAAYDVVTQEWIVEPPDLPDWSMASFPEGPGAAEEVRGIIEMAEGILRMPEPYRTQNGSALWEFVHSNRSDAFGPNGEGWWDMRNVVEKGLDQRGLMQPLFECHRRALEHPESLAAPADWSNSPA